jgi:hypothetical protein
MEGGAAWGALAVHRVLHWLNDNTLRGSPPQHPGAL